MYTRYYVMCWIDTHLHEEFIGGFPWSWWVHHYIHGSLKGDDTCRYIEVRHGLFWSRGIIQISSMCKIAKNSPLSKIIHFLELPNLDYPLSRITQCLALSKCKPILIFFFNFIFKISDRQEWPKMTD